MLKCLKLLVVIVSQANQRLLKPAFTKNHKITYNGEFMIKYKAHLSKAVLLFFFLSNAKAANQLNLGLQNWIVSVYGY